jgi:VanZ family protein
MNTGRWHKRLVQYGPLAGWIALIFFFSTTAASASKTSLIIEPILRFLFSSASAETIERYHFFIRKCAHFTEYALLAFWAVRAWASSTYRILTNNRYVLAIFLVLIVASLDEFNQSFEPSRTSTPWDVLRDCIGGSTMVLLLWAFHMWKRKYATE